VAAVEVPAAVVSATVWAVTPGTGAAGVVPTQVQGLGKVVLRTMFFKKLRIITVVLLGLVLTAAGVGLIGSYAAAMGRPGLKITTQPGAAADPEPDALQSPLRLKDVTLDAVDAAAGTVNLTVGKKPGGGLTLEIGGASPKPKSGKLQVVPDEPPPVKKLPRLLDVPVSKDARIVHGDQVLKVTDLKPGMRAAVELTTRDHQLTITSIVLKK